MPTKRQQMALDYIGNFSANHGHMPSYREIADRFNITPAAVKKLIDALATKGYVSKEKFARRSLKITEESHV